MSAGSRIEAGSIDIMESAADVAPVGVSRIIRKGGILKVSTDGGAYGDVVTTVASSTTIGADVQNVDFTGLNGDVDGDYILSGRIIVANSVSPVITVQPNQISANQEALTQSTVQAGAPSTSLITSMLLNAMPATDATGTPFIWFYMRLTALTGRVRRFIVQARDYTGTVGNNRRIIYCAGEWSDTTTVITSLRVAGNSAGVIKAGSFFVLQKTGINT